MIIENESVNEELKQETLNGDQAPDKSFGQDGQPVEADDSF